MTLKHILEAKKKKKNYYYGSKTVYVSSNNKTIYSVYIFVFSICLFFQFKAPGI